MGKRAQGGIHSGSRGQGVKSAVNEPRAASATSSIRELNARPSGGNAEGTGRFGTWDNPTLGSKETTDEVMLLLQARSGSATPQEQIRAGAEAPEWKHGPKLRYDDPPQ